VETAGHDWTIQICDAPSPGSHATGMCDHRCEWTPRGSGSGWIVVSTRPFAM
jgi:hypothetical protein